MDIGLLLFSLFVVGLVSVVIMYACESFDTAASYLGRDMAPGIKGATINAVGSSMPELLTTMAFLFLYKDLAGFSAGVATAAGSAIFNGLIIPAVCILVVTIKGVRQSDGSYSKVHHIEIGRHTILRDGCWLIIGEIVLIYFLGAYTLTWVAGASLLLIYLGYFIHLMRDNKKYGGEQEQDDDDDDDGEEELDKSFVVSLLTLDFHHIFFKNKPLNDTRAWIVLASSIIALSVACWGLADAVINTADALHIPSYFTAVILAAAATSIPDTILSVKDAREGDYDDAIANAIGSNIFDIAVSLGFPLLVYTLVFGAIELTHAVGKTAADVQDLRIVLLGITIVLVTTLWIKASKITQGTGFFLLALYAAWTIWVVSRAFQFT